MRTSLLGALFAIALASHGAGAQRSGLGVGALFGTPSPCAPAQPWQQAYEADRSHWLRVTQLSLGLEIGP